MSPFNDQSSLNGDTDNTTNVPLDDQTMVTQTVARHVVPDRLDLREHFLVMVTGGHLGRRIPFGTKPLVLGRKVPSDLVIEDSTVSGRHCEVIARGKAGDALVNDLQSTNGTFIDGKRVHGAMRLANGALLQVGAHFFKHEFRLPNEIAQSEELDRDLEKASHYVQSLLPAPVVSGPVRTDWFFQPSTKLGGDAFGYHQLDEHRFAGYLIDVSGHGAGAAMHSVSVMNVLRQRALPATDFAAPEQVLKSLNDMFQMESHAGMYFSIWYGVFDARVRTLRYASGGHHPAYLASPGEVGLLPLKTRNLVIGATQDARFVSQQADVPPGAKVIVFSDGVFEIVTKTGQQWDLPDLLKLLPEMPEDEPKQSQWIYRAVTDLAREGPLDDDFSVLIVTFL